MKTNNDNHNINSTPRLSNIALKSKKSSQALDYKIKEVLIRKYRNFIYNIEVLELIDEYSKTYLEIIQIEKIIQKKIIDSPDNRNILKEKNTSLDSSSPIKNSLERKSRRSLEDDYSLTETIEILKAKKSSIEGELYKLEVFEKRKYEANSELEQQNFEVQA